MNEPDPTIGFALSPKHIRNVLLEQSNRENINVETIKLDKENLGILAEIISVSRDISDEQQPDQLESLLGSGMGMVIKVKGRERFEILEVKKDITGCVIANVKILPDYVLNINPIRLNTLNNTDYFYDYYLNCKHDKFINQNLTSKAEYLNFSQPHPAWLYRKYDCSYLMNLIKKELSDTFEFNSCSINKNEEDESSINNFNDPLIFSLWLLNNFPFDNKARIDCLKMNCINHRLMLIYELLKQYTNIVCKYCNTILCAKSDAFSISKSFMNAFLNPGGVIHGDLIFEFF
jgi:hypothetical protein